MLTEISDLSIDSEFEGICPKLTDEEIDLLKQSIQADGIRDPIVVWDGHDDAIIDGYNRYLIANQIGLPKVQVTPLHFDSREDVIDWIVNNQLGRRNLTEEQKSDLRGRLYNSAKGTRGGDRKSNGQNVRLKNSAKELATEHGVSEKTIRRDGEFSTAVEAIAKNVGTDVKDEILSGKSDLTKADVVEVAAAPPESQKKVIAAKKKAATKKKKTAKKATKKPPDLKIAEEPVYDQVGEEITSTKIKQAFGWSDTFGKVARDITSVIRQVETLAASPAGVHLGTKTIISDLKNAQSAIKLSKPFAVCKYCGGKGCEPKGEAKGCRKSGWLPVRNKQAYQEGSK